MLYCDDCGKEKKYPICETDHLRSYGPCELCRNARLCNNIRTNMLDLGPVRIYHLKTDVFLKPDKKSFQASKGKLLIVGFDIQKLFGTDKDLFIPVNYHQEFTDRTTAVSKLKSLRKKQKSDSQQYYFLFNEKGYPELLNLELAKKVSEGTVHGRKRKNRCGSDHTKTK